MQLKQLVSGQFLKLVFFMELIFRFMFKQCLEILYKMFRDCLNISLRND